MSKKVNCVCMYVQQIPCSLFLSMSDRNVLMCGDMFYSCVHSGCPENTFTEVIRSRVGRVAVSVKRLRYGLDSAGIEIRWGRDIPHVSRPVLGPRSLLYNANWLSFLGVRLLRRVVVYPRHLAPRLKKEYRCTSNP